MKSNAQRFALSRQSSESFSEITCVGDDAPTRASARLWTRATRLWAKPKRDRQIDLACRQLAARLTIAIDARDVRSAVLETLRDAAHPVWVELVGSDDGPAIPPVQDVAMRFLGESVAVVRLHPHGRGSTVVTARSLVQPLMPLVAAALRAIEPAPRRAGLDRERRRRRVVLDLPRPAGIDASTGLPDAGYLEEVLQRASRQPETVPLAILIIEPRGLELVRSQQGPVYADSALGIVARAIVGTLRATDPVVRLSENRLAAVLPGAAPIDARRVAGSLTRAIAEAGQTASTPQALTADIGIANVPEHGVAARQLIQAALADLDRGDVGP